jgi:hypothetical protein
MPYTPCPKINLLAPGFPLFVPVSRPSRKSRWRPYGRRAPVILSIGGPEAGSYFKHRNAAARNVMARPNDDPSNDQPRPYPRRGDITPALKPTNKDI